MKRLTVAVVSPRAKFCDLQANLEHFATWVRKAADKGARLVCFPELALTSYTLRPAILEVAQKVPGPITDELARLAKAHKCFISVGLAEKARGKYHVCQAIVGPKGYVGKYRKYHPTGGELDAGFSPGKSFPTFDIDGFKLGVNICFDGRHEDTIEAMKKAKVDLIHHPHGNNLGLGTDAEEWTRGKLTYIAARAIHARAYIMINNSALDNQRPDGPEEYGSGALIIDPLGQVVKRTKQRNRGEKMVVATLVKPLAALIPKFELGRL